MKDLVVVIGDTHSRIDLAVEGIERIEAEYQRTVAQVFSAGDLGLFLEETDWNFLTGPKKYRHPELSKNIRAAWKKWRWPLSSIAGNHEPFNRLRDFDPGYFDGKLNYTNAGKLLHSLEGLRVVGLSGIYHPHEYSSRPSGATSWAEMVEQVKNQKLSTKVLSYYKMKEVELLKKLPPRPDLLLLHDWPITPAHLAPSSHKPEADIVEALKPAVVCCGHHHTGHHFTIGATEGYALNIINSKESRYRINQDWAALFEYVEGRFSFLTTWPKA